MTLLPPSKRKSAAAQLHNRSSLRDRTKLTTAAASTDAYGFFCAFELWWEWAEKLLGSMLMIPAEIDNVVMAMPPEERRDRVKVNAAVRHGSALLDRVPEMAEWKRSADSAAETGADRCAIPGGPAALGGLERRSGGLFKSKK